MLPKKLSNFLKVFGERENLLQKGLAKKHLKTSKKKAYALGGAQFKKFARPGGIPSSFFIIAEFSMPVNIICMKFLGMTF